MKPTQHHFYSNFLLLSVKNTAQLVPCWFYSTDSAVIRWIMKLRQNHYNDETMSLFILKICLNFEITCFIFFFGYLTELLKWRSDYGFMVYDFSLIESTELLDEIFFPKSTGQKIKFFMKNFLWTNCEQISRNLWSRSHLLKKSWAEELIFCAVVVPKFQKTVDPEFLLTVNMKLNIWNMFIL